MSIGIPEILQIGFLAGTFRKVCFGHNPIRLPYDEAKAYCESSGASLPKCLNQEEHARLIGLL